MASSTSLLPPTKSPAPVQPGGQEGTEAEGGGGDRPHEREPAAPEGRGDTFLRPGARGHEVAPAGGGVTGGGMTPSPRKAATSLRPQSSPSHLPSMGGGAHVSADKYGHGLYSPTNELLSHTYLDSAAAVRRGLAGRRAGGEQGGGGAAISGAEVLRRQRAPLTWLQSIAKEIAKEGGGAPPARSKIWGRAAAELLQMQRLEAGRRDGDPAFVLKQWSQRKADVERQLHHLEAEHAEHTCRSESLKSRADLMEHDLMRLRTEKERSVVVAMTSLAALHQLKTADAARVQQARSRTLVSWARWARLVVRRHARAQLLRHFGRKRKKQRTLLRVHGGGAEGSVRKMLEYVDVLRQQVATLAALRTGLQQLRAHYSAADAKLQELKGEKEEEPEVLASLKALEGEMDRVVSDIDRRTKFYSSVDDGFGQQVQSRAYQERAKTELAVNTAAAMQEDLKTLRFENLSLRRERSELQQAAAEREARLASLEAEYGQAKAAIAEQGEAIQRMEAAAALERPTEFDAAVEVRPRVEGTRFLVAPGSLPPLSQPLVPPHLWPCSSCSSVLVPSSRAGTRNCVRSRRRSSRRAKTRRRSQRR